MKRGQRGARGFRGTRGEEEREKDREIERDGRAPPDRAAGWGRHCRAGSAVVEGGLDSEEKIVQLRRGRGAKGGDEEDLNAEHVMRDVWEVPLSSDSLAIL